MHLIHVETVDERDGLGEPRTWLVIADSLSEAISLTPAGFARQGATIQPGVVSGAARVIGWLGRSQFDQT